MKKKPTTKLTDELLQNGIRQRRAELEEKLSSAEEDLRLLQDTCSHPNKTTQYHSNSGNYDPSADSEWNEHTCPDCGKRWTVEIK